VETSGVWGPALLVSCCVTSDRFFKLSVHQFPTVPREKPVRPTSWVWLNQTIV
jgi:hypothetical protein